jgi:hypothetical protein
MILGLPTCRVVTAYIARDLHRQTSPLVSRLGNDKPVLLILVPPAVSLHFFFKNDLPDLTPGGVQSAVKTLMMMTNEPSLAEPAPSPKAILFVELIRPRLSHRDS